MLAFRPFRILILTLGFVYGFVWTASAQFGAGLSRGVLHSKEISEASGLVASVAFPGFLWTHNDSGDQARIYLIDDQARHRATFLLEGVDAVDWEDVGRMRYGGRDYLIVGDIGDNRARREFVTVHIFPEPEIHSVLSLSRDPLSEDVDGVDSARKPRVYEAAVSVDTVPADQIRTFRLRYEDGPRDAEALFFDPLDERLYILSKRDLQVGVYGVRFDAGLVPLRDTLLLLKRETSLPYTFVTAADISPDGNEILIKNLLHVFYWKRQAGESIPQLFARAGREQVYRPEPQGEALAFAADGTAYYTLSERVLGLPVHLYYYKRSFILVQ